MPALLVVAVVMLFPLLYNISLSFFEKTIYNPDWTFVGLEQYQKLLTSKTFLNALKNTVVWTFFSVLFQMPAHASVGLAGHHRQHGVEVDVPFGFWNPE